MNRRSTDLSWQSAPLRAKSWLITAVAMLAVTIVAFFDAYNVASNLTQTSDSSQGFVVGHAITTGNFFLVGWHFPVDNFYFTDAIPYALAQGIVGSRRYLLALIPALVYAVPVLLALVLCFRPGQPSGKNLEPIAATLMLWGVPVRVGAWNPVLMSDMHAATAVAALAALALCASIATVTSGGFVTTLAFLLVAITVASDPFSLLFAFGPAAAVLAIDAARNRDLPNVRFAFLLLGVAIAVGLLLPWVIARLGGFTTENDVALGFAATRQWSANFVDVMFSVLTLWGINPLNVDGVSDVPTLAIRSGALFFVLFGGVVLVRNLLRGSRVAVLDRLLYAGAALPLAVCVPSAQFAKGVKMDSMWHGGPPMRFLVPTVLFATVLACRQITGALDSVANASLRLAFRIAVVGLAGLALLTDVQQSRSGAARPHWIDQNPAIIAARWLEQHGFSQGVGEYWSANLLTAMSGNTIGVRSVVPENGRLAPYVWVETRAFYASPPQFAIWQEPNQSGVTAAIVRATWPVCATRTVAGYRIALLQFSRKNMTCASP